MAPAISEAMAPAISEAVAKSIPAGLPAGLKLPGGKSLPGSPVFPGGQTLPGGMKLPDGMELPSGAQSATSNTAAPEMSTHASLSLAQMGEINNLRKELEELLLKYTKANPKVMMLDSKINFLTNYYENLNNSTVGEGEEGEGGGMSELTDGMKIAKFEANTELKALDANIKSIKERIKEFEKSLTDIVKVKSLYDKIKSKIDINKELLDKLDNIIGTTEIALNANVKDLEILKKGSTSSFS